MPRTGIASNWKRKKGSVLSYGPRVRDPQQLRTPGRVGISVTQPPFTRCGSPVLRSSTAEGGQTRGPLTTLRANQDTALKKRSLNCSSDVRRLILNSVLQVGKWESGKAGKEYAIPVSLSHLLAISYGAGLRDRTDAPDKGMRANRRLALLTG
jgi:hypothetical protein